MRKSNRKITLLCYMLVLGLFLSFLHSCSKKNIPPHVNHEKFPWFDGISENGEIKEDVRASTPNWSYFTPKVAPVGSPNILFVLYDDTGLGAWSPYGGGIKMPTLDALAKDGLTYTQWHTTALCSPTRSTILTGRNHHLNGMASITETADGFPGSNGRVPPECASFAEILQTNGYSTFWIGKNHNVPETDVAPGGNRAEWPCQVGFDRYYGFLGGETNNWYPDLVEDNHFIEAPATPEEGYHLSKDLTDKAIEMLRNQNASNPSKPWYMWFCPGANHAPHHSPLAYSNIYKEEKTFIGGYERYREHVLDSMVARGIIPEGTVLTGVNFMPDSVSNPLDSITPWGELKPREKQLFIRMAEVYAGFSTYTDYHIGRIIDYLKETGQYDNTIILYAADNGASGEGTPAGSVNENKFFNGYPDDIDENLLLKDSLGRPDTYNHFPTGWAAAFSTPFKMFKRYSQFAGGTNDPLVITWPDGISENVRGELRHQYHHSVDIVPTLLEATGIEMPKVYNGVEQEDLSGVSMMYTFDDNCEPHDSTHKKVQYYSMLGTRGIWANGWKALALHAPTSGYGKFEEDVWELYHVDADRSESKNLAEEHPALLKTLIAEWYVQAAKNKVLPLDDRSADQILTIERPSPEPPTDTYTYYPFTAAVPEGVAANLRGRSYDITATVKIEKTFPTPSGILFAHGSRFGGHTLFIKNNRLHYVYNFLGISDKQQHLISKNKIPNGPDVKLEVKFELDPDNPGEYGVPQGMATLYINGVADTQATIATQPAKFTLSGDGLCVGYDSADKITNKYPEPSEFSDGTIKNVRVWVDTTTVAVESPEVRRRRVLRSH